MVRSTLVLAVGSGLMAILCIVLMQLYAFSFDYYFYLIPLGSAIFGAAIAAALFCWRGGKRRISEDLSLSVQLLAASALAGATCLLGFFIIPIGPISIFLLFTGFIVLPFMAWAYALCIQLSADGEKKLWPQLAVTAGLMAGALLSPILIDYVGSVTVAGWIACSLLILIALLGVTKGSLPFVLISAVLVIGLSANQISSTQNAHLGWVKSSPYIIKPILGALSTDKNMTASNLGWDAQGKTELLESVKKAGDYDWVLTNSTSPVPIVEGEKPLSWWRERFPLVVLPVSVSNPKQLLTVGPIPGPEVVIGDLFGVSNIYALAYNRKVNSLGDLLPDAYKVDSMAISTNIDISTNTARYVLKKENKSYDLIYLPITHPSQSGFVGSNLAEKYLYTKEAIRLYWSRLNDGAMLAITTRDEILFLRALMTVWKMYNEDGEAYDGKRFHQQAWAVRLLPLAPFKGSYQYLIMITKGEVTGDRSNNIKNLINQYPVEALFGPGIKSVRPYHLLEDAADIERARLIFTKMSSRRINKLVDLREVTDLRPFFFHIVQDAHPYYKWLLTVCLVILIAVLVFPLSRLRRINVSGSTDHLPLPILLGYFILLAGSLMVITVGVMQRISLLSVAPEIDRLVLLATIIAGCGSGFIFFRILSQEKARMVCLFAPVVVITILGVMHMILEVSGASDIGSITRIRQIAATVSLLIVVMGMCMTLQIGMRYLDVTELSELAPWAWIAFGAASLAGIVLANWWSRLWGWTLLWELAAGFYILAYLIWIWARRRSSVVQKISAS